VKLFNNGEDEKLLYDAFKIIADYMGWEVFTDSGFSNYYRKNTVHGYRHEGKCLSLDVMAIIWDKLRTAPRFYLTIGDTNWIRCDIPIYDENNCFEAQCVGAYTKTESSAIATARAIKKLNK